ncbi:MAG: 30S ribosome-binding factor RbfA [Desulfobacterales bacterium]|jgi:ribosome-binding factor A|nr:30S ribosome-binding factor RbfA [Desulfobacterales bacterium]
MTGFSRADRVGGLIQKLLAELLQKDISDPRLQMATITEVKVTKDLRRARIYFTLAGGKELSEQTAQGFRSAAGFIKRHLGPRLGLRYMPELDFFYDESFDHGARIDQLLKSISSSDHGPDHTEN